MTTSYAWGDTEAEKRKHLLRQSVSPLGTVSTFQYDAYGNTIETQKKESGASTAKFIKSTVAYTAAGTYVVSQTDARGKTATTVTDPDRGTVTQSTDPLGQEVNSQYDALRRLTKTSTMLNNQEVKTEHTYDSQTGYLTGTSHNTDGDPTHSVVYHFSYDSLGRQTSVSVGSNVLSTTYYDAIRRMVDRIVFGNGGQVKYLYDSFSRVTGIRYDGADENRFSYGYDAQGRTAYVTDHAREVTVYTDYDLAGRPCRKTHLAGAAHAYTGELTYNAYDLPNAFTEYVGAARARYTTGFGYDDENRLTALTYGTGSAAYAYDGLGRVTQRTVQPAATPIQTAYTYVSGGYGAQSATGLIQTITQGGVTLTYTYDDNGNIVSVSDGTKTTGYVYDAIGQLIRVNDETDTTAGAAGTTWVYTYDLGGNILTKAAYPYTTGTVGTATESHAYTYGNAGWKDQLTAFDGVTVTYDAMGNPLNDGTWTYTWEHGRQLKQMTRIDGTESVAFEYNEDGLRTKKTATGTGVTEYTLHGKNIVHMTQGSHALHFYYDAQSKPSIVIFDGTPYAYLYNLQGDVIALVNGTGAKVVEYAYDAWGKVLSTTGSLASTLGTVQPFRYRGYIYDAETGLYYLRSRYYNPTWGRFVSADSILTSNLFIYCENNPVNKDDKDGKESIKIIEQSEDRISFLIRVFIKKYKEYNSEPLPYEDMNLDKRIDKVTYEKKEEYIKSEKERIRDAVTFLGDSSTAVGTIVAYGINVAIFPIGGYIDVSQVIDLTDGIITGVTQIISLFDNGAVDLGHFHTVYSLTIEDCTLMGKKHKGVITITLCETGEHTSAHYNEYFGAYVLFH